jgi:ribulose-phosphate 3-epimerase
MNILPAIIPESFEDLESRLLQVRGLAHVVQIDICDGRLTPSASWPYIGDRGQLGEILGQERGFPLWEHFEFEIDLMVLNPSHEYEQWIDAGASRIIFHYKESEATVLKDLMQKTKERGVEVGLALHLDHAVEVFEEFKELCSIVQFMGIKHIGFQGEPFEKEVLERVKKAKELYPDTVVSVDGGVNFDTGPMLVEVGADQLIVGSAIFGNPDVRDAVNYFKSLEPGNFN